MNKYLIGFLIVLASVFTPGLTSSKSIEKKDETVILSKSNLLLLNTEVNGEATAKIIASAKELDAAMSKGILANNKPLYVFLNTPGGSIQSGLEMIEALHGIGRQINTVILFAASMGWQISQNLDDRLILKNGVLMSHHATGEFQGSFGGVNPSQVDARYQLWLDRVRELDEQTVRRTNGKQTYESYTKQYDHEMWLTGTKAVEQGYADRIVLVKCDASLSGVTSRTAEAFGFSIAFDLDNCPINTSPMNVRVALKEGGPVSPEVAAAIKEKFMSQYFNKQKQVTPMSW